MATNEIVLFADSGTISNSDVMDLTAYNADTDRTRGNQTGIARRELVNTAMRQTSLMCTSLATYIANRVPSGVLDIDPLTNPSGQAVSLVEQGISEAIASDLASNSTFGTTVAGTPNAFVKSNAQGTINFSTTGNAATATKLATTRSVTATGNTVTMDATAFDGTANLVLNITGLNATQLTSGVVPVGRLPAVTSSANGAMLAQDKIILDAATSANTANTLVKRGANGEISVGILTATNINATMAGDGSALTNLNASNLTSGTVPVARLPLVTSTSHGAMSFTDKVAFDARTHLNTASTIVVRDSSGNFAAGTITAANIASTNITATTLSGNGSSLSNLNATNITTGTVATARLPYASASADGIVTSAQRNGIERAIAGTNNNTASTLVARDASGNFSAGTITASLAGNATSATQLQTARTIGGVSFNGTANINLPGVNIAGNQNTSGTAANATAWNNMTMRSGAGLTGQAGTITFTW